MNFWLVKQEPSKYSWDQFVKDKGTYWDGVRNYQARNNLQKMKKGDLLLFYHSVVGKDVRGIAKVSKEYYPDPTTDDPRWVVVDLKPVKPMSIPVTLDDIKAQPNLSDIALNKQSRLSVMPLSKNEFKTILKMGQTKVSGI
jgi:predicted RNA-binding protein with PUA-like domain